MSHPYAAHRQTAVEHNRVSRLTKGYASGGAVNRTQDEIGVRKMPSKQMREVNPEGGVAPRRADRPQRAKGGRVKGNAKTIVNVITGGDKAAPPPMPIPVPAASPPMGVAPPMAPKPPMPAPPMAGPPMPMRAKGGRVNQGGKVYEAGKKAGTQVSHDRGKSDIPDMNRKKVVTFATGGGVVSFATGGRVESPQGVAKATKLPGGGGGGEARLAKAHRASRKS